MTITLAIRNFLASLSRNPQAVKYGAFGAGGAVAGWELSGMWKKASQPFTVGGTNYLPFILIGLVVLWLWKTKRI